MQGKLLRCIECNEIISITEHDSSPEYHYDEKGDRFIELAKNDREPFITKHKNHKIEELRVNRASYISDRPYSEPLKAAYFEATNGREDFVIKKWREKIESPLRYELIKGYIEITDIKLDVQGENIRKQIQAEINPSIVEDKITCLIQLVERVVSQLDLETLLEDSVESDNPLVLYCKLTNDTTKNIIELSKDIFEGEEFKRVEDFINKNNDYDGVIAPLVKYRFEIRSSHKTGERPQEEFNMQKAVG